MSALPPEVLQHLFGFFSFRTLKCAPFVCYQWYETLQDEGTWRWVFERKYGRLCCESCPMKSTDACAKYEGWRKMYLEERRKYRLRPWFDTRLRYVVSSGHTNYLRRADITLSLLAKCKGLLYEAAESGCVEAVSILIKWGISPNDRAVKSLKPEDAPTTALYIAAQRGHFDVVRTLVELGAEVQELYRSNYTPVYIAAKMGHATIVEFLVRCGVDVNWRCADGSTALYVASQHGQEDCVRVLLQAGATDDILFEDKWSPLYVSSQNGHASVARLLCESGADVSRAAIDIAPAIYIAAQNGHTQTVDVLVAYHADVNGVYRAGYTPLYIASQKGHLDVVKILVERGGANIHSRTGRQATPFYTACAKLHLDVAEYLLNRGADINCRFETGLTPLRHAQNELNREVVKFLEERGAIV